MQSPNNKKSLAKLSLLVTLPALLPPALISATPGNPATDALGRKLPTYEQVGKTKPGKEVGMFYWTWHTQQAQNSAAPYVVSDFLKQDPNALYDYKNPVWPKQAGSFFWGEPLFGFYLDTDNWVLRKHAEMLAEAGVDFVVFDCTNGSFTWKESYMELCKVWDQARKDGVKVPKIAFMLAFGPTDGSRKAFDEIYNDLYKPGLYKDLWYMRDGKPLIMAYPEMFAEESSKRQFFTFRPGQPVYNHGPGRDDHWGWLEITPQHGFVKKTDGKFEQVTVGVSQNWVKDKGLSAMNAPGAFGRSYTHKNGLTSDTQAVNYGLNFQEQWDHAIQLDPEVIFVTGWNEWIMGRFDNWQSTPNAFPDQFDQEHSRDIEPMKGGHGDNYYYQLIANVRKFKGTEPQAPASPAKTIAIDGNFDDWNSVKPEFQSYKGNTLHRDHPGWKTKHYKNATGRNDLVLAKVARDKDNVYFYMETADKITSPSSPAWMRLFIDTDRDKKTGWEGYDYVINRLNPTDKSAVIEKSSAGWNWTKSGEATYSVAGNKIEIAVPRKIIANDKLDFEFKWSDNMQTDGDIMDFYTNGDTAPLGRFNFRFMK